MAPLVYLLCAATSLLCAVLLVRGYRRSRSRLLLWSSLAFIGLATNNALLVVDRLLVKDVDLSTVRLVPAVIGMACLVYGLIWEGE
ncbi:MAG TPA: DUF5985 family protein [Acidimicrobiales bacterium]|jgi:hypothetical protein|nr:DUF5985 family protein [Acidimicrobiales bacterium]